MRDALGLFVRLRAGLSKELGKVLMHTGPAAQGSHYILFDYANAAAAIAELPKLERRRYREPLMEDLLRARTEDGGFLDNPSRGIPFGAGMALWTFAGIGI